MVLERGRRSASSSHTHTHNAKQTTTGPHGPRPRPGLCGGRLLLCFGPGVWGGAWPGALGGLRGGGQAAAGEEGPRVYLIYHVFACVFPFLFGGLREDEIDPPPPPPPHPLVAQRSGRARSPTPSRPRARRTSRSPPACPRGWIRAACPLPWGTCWRCRRSWGGGKQGVGFVWGW